MKTQYLDKRFKRLYVAVRNVVTEQDIVRGVVDLSYVDGWIYILPSRCWYRPEYVYNRRSER